MMPTVPDLQLDSWKGRPGWTCNYAFFECCLFAVVSHVPADPWQGLTLAIAPAHQPSPASQPAAQADAPQAPQAPSLNIQAAVEKEVKKALAARTVARYGNLLKRYYNILDQLPSECLPATVPQGKHRYSVSRMNDKMRFTVTLDQQKILLEHPQHEFVQLPISFKDHVGGPGAAWMKAKALWLAWTRCPVDTPEEARDLGERTLRELSE